LFPATPRASSWEACGGTGLEGCAAGDATRTGVSALTPHDPGHHHARRLAVIAATHPASARLKRSAPNGEFYVWLEPQYVHQLRATRKLGETFSEVIVRLAEASEGA
jgi:hypothetical protein